MNPKTKRILAVVFSCILLLCAFASCGQAAANNTNTSNTNSGDNQNNVAPVEKKVIHLATTVQNSMPAGAACEYFVKLINERTGGRYEVQYHPAGELGQTDELLTNVMGGTLEIAQISISNISSYTNILEAVQYPFMLTNYDQEKKAFTSDEFKAIMKSVDETLGVHNLIIMEHGARHFANNVRPVTTPADLKGQKLRVSTTKLNQEILEALGVNPVFLAYGQIYSSLQSGVIDGEEINYTSVYSEKHYEELKYFTDMALWPFPAMLMMSGNFWNSLSAEDQEIFTKAAEEAFEYNFKLLDEATATAKKTMEEAGVAINVIEDNSEFLSIAQPYIDKAKTANKLTEDFVNMCLNMH